MIETRFEIVNTIIPATNILREIKDSGSVDAMLSKYLGLRHPSAMQLIRALENLGYVKYETELGWTPTKKLLVASGNEVKN